ncbi:MAG: hypothetical protein RMK73_15125 [Geminicoccaceae bacterium]|nr:hypothetical protein [Geminicoccaceae bacterium]
MHRSRDLRGLALAGVLALAVWSLVPGAPASAQPLSLGEQFALRSYTGAAMGQVLTGIVKAERVGVLTNPTSICGSLVGAMGAQVVSTSKAPDAFAVAALAKPEDAAPAVAAFKDRNAVALIFGGQMSPEENYALTKAALRALAEADYKGALFLHLRIWVPKFAEKAAAEDPVVAKYLAGKQNVYTVTVDVPNGKALVHRVSFAEPAQRSVEVLHQVVMNPTWLDLFKRSI